MLTETRDLETRAAVLPRQHWTCLLHRGFCLSKLTGKVAGFLSFFFSTYIKLMEAVAECVVASFNTLKVTGFLRNTVSRHWLLLNLRILWGCNWDEQVLGAKTGLGSHSENVLTEWLVILCTSTFFSICFTLHCRFSAFHVSKMSHLVLGESRRKSRR